MKLLQKIKFQSEIKPVIKNLQDKPDQLKNKQAKGVKLHANTRLELLKNFFSEYLKDRICKIKQHLNYILMIINQNILAILRSFSNLQKDFYENPNTNETPKMLLLKFKKKTKKHQVAMALQVNFISTFQMN